MLRPRAAAILAFIVATSLSAQTVAQCVDNAVDVSSPPDTGVDCSCNRGYTGDGKVECTACTAGKAKGLLGASACVPCAPGNFSSLDAQSACMQCPAGQFTGTPGATACTNCTAGYFSNGGASVCSECSAGKYNAKPKSQSCTPCPSGTASTTLAAKSNTTCAFCLAGSYSATGSSACIDCTVGKYSEVGATECISCPVGKASAAMGTETKNIVVIRPDGPEAVTIIAADSSGVCKYCVGGFFSSELGASACISCAPGKYSYAEATICTDCEPGKASFRSEANNSALCTDCTKGSWSGTGYASCVLCTAGKSGNVTGAIDEESCEACVGGTFSNAGQAWPCTGCPVGTYSQLQAPVCTNCSAGTASPAEGLAACECTVASNHFECPLTLCEPVCQPCTAGNFSHPGSARCLQCSPGFFSAEPKSGACIPCELGFYNPYTEASTCIECPINTYANETGLPACHPCPTNLFSRSGSIDIKDCRTAQIEVSPNDPNWGTIVENAPEFASIFLRPGNYTGYCNLKVNAVKIEGIMGKSRTIMDCEGKARHFHIDGTRNITLIGITLRNGYSSEEDGGCVWLTQGVLTLIDSNLENCRTGLSGGAFHISIRSILDCRRSTIDGCFAGLNGGCLNIKNSTVRMTGVTMRNGHAGSIGGGVYLEDISNLQTRDTSISDCSASGGGGMAFKGVKIRAEVTRTQFLRNRATGTTDGLSSGGGAILVLDNTDVNLNYSIFTDNKALYSGGALRIATASHCTADTSRFVRNEASLYGGCMRVGDGSSFTGKGNWFETNWGRKGAGVIAFSSSSAGGGLKNSKFIFDPNVACLGCQEGNTQNFAACLDGGDDVGYVGEQFQAFLQQPCTIRTVEDDETGFLVQKNTCEDSECWGVNQVSWTGSSCQVLSDGWRPSRVAGCGGYQKWIWPNFVLPEDYYTFEEPPPPPHEPPKNNPELAIPPYEYYVMLASMAQSLGLGVHSP